MTTLRRRLAWVVCAWLCCHVSVLAVTPVSLCSGVTASADAVECTCTHGPNADCPMHHHRPKSPSDCNCGNNSMDPASVVVASIFGPVAILAPAPLRLVPPAIAGSLDHPLSGFTSFVAGPDGPPPRA